MESNTESCGARRRIRRRIRVVAAGVCVAAATTLPAAHARPPERLIQPGAPVYPGHTPLGPWSPCTLNFVFRDAQHTYIGTAARCTVAVGERVTMDDREFGTVVFRAFTGSEEPTDTAGNLNSIDDFALIRVDPSEVHRVSPVVLGTGRSPHGTTTSAQTAEPTVLIMTGQGVGLSGRLTRTRPGVLLSDDARGFRAVLPVSVGDPGAPVMTDAFEALGVYSALNGPGAFGTTVERILRLLVEGGYDVQLVTAWEST